MPARLHAPASTCLGWEWATRLAISHDVTVLTSAERLKESEGHRPAALRMLPVPDRAIRPLKRMGLLGWHLYYLLWHVAATRLGRRLLAQERFDIVHQCTFHTVRVPARLWERRYAALHLGADWRPRTDSVRDDTSTGARCIPRADAG